MADEYYSQMMRAVEIRIHIPADQFYSNTYPQRSLRIVSPTNWEGATPEVVSHSLRANLKIAYESALAELAEMGY